MPRIRRLRSFRRDCADPDSGDVRRGLVPWTRFSAAILVFCVFCVRFAEPASSQQPLSYTWGSDEAPIVVIEFVDFGCSACATFHEETYATLFREYVDTDKARWTFVPFVSGQFQNSMEAAEAASCAARQPGGLSVMTAKLFADQQEWSRASDPVAVVVGYAESLGLDAAAVETCVRERQTEAGIRAAGERARELGVRATPTFFMNGFPVPGALPVVFFRQMFDKHLEGGGGPSE